MNTVRTGAVVAFIALFLTGCAQTLADVSKEAGDELSGVNNVVATNIWRSLCAMPMGAAYRRLEPEDFERLIEIVKASNGTCATKP